MSELQGTCDIHGHWDDYEPVSRPHRETESCINWRSGGTMTDTPCSPLTCPYHPNARGWAMHPDLWAQMKTRHDQEHAPRG